MRTRFLWLAVVMAVLGARLAPAASGQSVPKPNPDRSQCHQGKAGASQRSLQRNCPHTNGCCSTARNA